MEEYKIYKVNCNKRNEYAFSSNVSRFVLYVATPKNYEINTRWLDNYLKESVCDQISVVDIFTYKGKRSNVENLMQLYSEYSLMDHSSFFMDLDDDVEKEFNKFESYNRYIRSFETPKGLPFSFTSDSLDEQIEVLNNALNKYHDSKANYVLFANDYYKELFTDRLNVDFNKAVLFNWNTGRVVVKNKEIKWDITPEDKDFGVLIMYAYIGDVFVGLWHTSKKYIHLHFWRKDGDWLKDSPYERTIEDFIDAYKKIPNENSIWYKAKKLFTRKCKNNE